MWIDGVLDEDRSQRLRAEPGLTSLLQYDLFSLADFTFLPSRFSTDTDRFRYLDPHRFVVSTDAKCSRLEINFNPTPSQIQQLHDFENRIKLLTRKST